MDAVSLDVATVAQGQRFRSSIFLAGFGTSSPCSGAIGYSLRNPVVLLYDHLMTLPSEVKYIWARPTKRSSAWFLFVRYPALLCNLSMTAVIFGNFSPELQTILCLRELLARGTLAIRVCAMYGFNRRVFVSLSIAAIVTVSVAAVCVNPSSCGSILTLLSGRLLDPAAPLKRCYLDAMSQRHGHDLAVAWESLLVGDMLILGLTLRRVVYFGIICAVNLANIVILYCGDVRVPLKLRSAAHSWISVTMVSRLMLNLHDAAMGGSGDSITGQDPDPMRFQWPTEIGTVGATA
ncbi:hypothetical protein DFH07DRAFT_766904 [Mycena maculata]|uniref:DUF6533 domain-containing protein n=1 Tax=Mycena maculata TaxID=230809 RepID=A0AAD7K104_9AGAR|nr:hypothetical protein DFH07DRAFT_766904 [Mycena maculata]